MAGFIDKAGKEFGAGGVVRGLVRDGPQNHRGLVAVAADHLLEHRDILCVHLRLIEGDVLPIGNLGPDHDAVTVSGPFHTLIVRVVAESDEVGIQLLDIAEDSGDILIVVRAAAPNRRFGVNVDAFQKDGLPIEENACSIDPDVAKADVVGEFVDAGCEPNFVKFGRFG